MEALEQSILAARTARADEFDGAMPLAEVDQELLESYVGEYQIAPGDNIAIVLKAGRLRFVDRGQQIDLDAESERRFLLRTVDEITVTFEAGPGGNITHLLLAAGQRTVRASRIE